MTLAPRQQEILDLARDRGYVSIDELAQAFAVTPRPSAATSTSSPSRACCAHPRRRRQRGVEHPEHRLRHARRTDARREAAHRRSRGGADPDHASLFINIGTTTEAIARELLGHKGLKVITNNLHVAAQLADRPDFEVLVAGGTVRSDGGIVGQSAVDFIQQFKVDFAIVGISGIDDDGSLLDFDYQEVRVSQAIIDNARQVLLAADSSKFGRNAVVRLGSIALVDRMITDHAPSPPWPA